MDLNTIRKAVQQRDVALYSRLHEDLSKISFRADMLATFVDALFVQALGRPEEIDDLLNYAAKVARKLTEIIAADEFAEDSAETLRGGQRLLALLAQRLAKAAAELSKTEVTPDEDDMEFLKPNYWHTARVHGILLARFATVLYGPHPDDGLEDLSQYAAASTQDELWEKAIVTVLGRTIFSRGSQPPPNGLVVALALLEGAAGTLSRVMKPVGQRVGQGVNWTWYDGAFADDKKQWDFDAVVVAVQQGIEGEYADRFMLPGGLVSTFANLGGAYVDLDEAVSSGGSSSKSHNLTSKKLVGSTFGWVDDLKPNGDEVGLRVHRATALVTLAKEVLARLERQENDTRYGYDGVALLTDSEELKAQYDALAQFAKQIGVPSQVQDGWDWTS